MVPLQNITIGQAVEEAARKFGKNPAIEYEKVIWNYEELNFFSDSMAKAFLALGITRGSHVALWGNVEPNMLFAFFALHKIGAVAVMLYTSLKPELLEEQLLYTDCRHLIVSKKLMQDEVRNICSSLTNRGICKVFTLGSEKIGELPNFGNLLSGASKVTPAQLRQAKDLVQPQDPAVILFTSGTSGKSKAVVTTHYSRINGGIQQAADMGATEKDSFCVVLPMFHCFCISTNIMAALAVGGKLHLLPDRHTETILNAISNSKCTVLNAVPTLYNAMCRRSDLEQYDLSSLRIGFIGGGTYSPLQFQEFEETLGITLLSSLGLTEATAGITVCDPDDPMEVRCTTVGHFMSHVEGKIIDLETKETLPTGKSGEICVRGYGIMAGYYKEPELTAQAVDPDGWLHTGDLGWMDDAGYLHLCGRIKDLVIRGGENISPLEVSNCILSHDLVKDVRVIGVPDPHYGEELCACVVPASPDVRPKDIRDYAAQRLDRHKVPRYVLFFEQLPYNTTGKINTPQLRQMVRASGTIPGLE